jgi:hypothetical protein
MAYWLEDPKKLSYFHGRATDHAPQGEVDFKRKQHLNFPRRVELLNSPTFSSENEAARPTRPTTNFEQQLLSATNPLPQKRGLAWFNNDLLLTNSHHAESEPLDPDDAGMPPGLCDRPVHGC